jgi:hypothetical protein
VVARRLNAERRAGPLSGATPGTRPEQDRAADDPVPGNLVTVSRGLGQRICSWSPSLENGLGRGGQSVILFEAARQRRARAEPHPLTPSPARRGGIRKLPSPYGRRAAVRFQTPQHNRKPKASRERVHRRSRSREPGPPTASPSATSDGGSSLLSLTAEARIKHESMRRGRRHGGPPIADAESGARPAPGMTGLARPKWVVPRSVSAASSLTRSPFCVSCEHLAIQIEIVRRRVGP